MSETTTETEKPVEKSGWRRASEVEQQETPQTEVKAEEVVETPPAPPEPPKLGDEVKVIDYWKQIGEKSGYEFQSEEQIIEELKSKRDLSTKLTDYESKLKTLNNLDPLALDIDRAAKAGMDMSTYLKARDMDVTKLQGKELLKREFLLKNQSLVKSDEDFALQKFERDYQKSFGVLEQKRDMTEATDEERLAYEEQCKDAEFELKAKSLDAKGFLADWQKNNVSIPEAVQKGMTEEQVQQYYNQAESSVDDLETIELQIGDKAFKFGVDEYKSSLKNDLINPIESLKRFGIDLENGQIDPIKYQELLLPFYAMNDQKLFTEFARWNTEQATALKVTTPPAPPHPNPGGSLGAEKTKGEQIAAIVAAKRKTERDADR